VVKVDTAVENDERDLQNCCVKLSQEEVLNITMGKYRKTQQLLEEAERRADRAGGVNVVRYSTTTLGGAPSAGAGGRVISRSRAMSVSRQSYY